MKKFEEFHKEKTNESAKSDEILEHGLSNIFNKVSNILNWKCTSKDELKTKINKFIDNYDVADFKSDKKEYKYHPPVEPHTSNT